MKEKLLGILVSVLAAMVALACLYWWLSRNPTAGFAPNMPGMDDPDGLRALLAKAARTQIGDIFESFPVTPDTNTAACWPRFRGANYDNISAESVPLSTDWGEKGPPVLWSLELGEGHAAPAVHKGRVFLIDYDEQKKNDMLRCFSLSDGRELWRRGYRVGLKRNHGISRTIPAVTDRYVLTIGPKCHVMCVDTDTGNFRWGIDMVADYGTTVPGWYAGQCPMIDEGLAILAPAGTNVLVMAVDCQTGRTVWSTPNTGKWTMSHASIMPMSFGGRRMFVYSAVGGTAGIAANGPDRGQILWQTTEWEPSVIAPSPVVLNDGRIYFTAGYGAGSMMIQLVVENGRFSVKKLFRKNAREWMACEQQTPLYYKDLLFSIQPSDAGGLRKQFVCFHPDGKMVWASGETERFGLGPFMLADGKFFILDDYGVLTVAEASTTGYKRLARAKILNGHDSWGPFALVEGRLLLRDSKRMVCLDLRKK